MAIGRGPNSFLQKNVPKLETGEKGAIAIGDHHETSIPGVFASGDVTTGETLVVKAMASGRDGAQRVHEYLMKVPEGQHLSFYEKYYLGRSYDRMMEGLSGMGAPPA
jgi:NADPH-dependent glutamate synthase beta subunit-like oxidoreductase